MQICRSALSQKRARIGHYALVAMTRSANRSLLASLALVAATVVVVAVTLIRGSDDSSSAKRDVTLRSGSQLVAGHVEITTPDGDHVRSVTIGRSGSASVALRYGDYRVAGLSHNGLFCGPSTLHSDNSPGQGAVLLCHQ